MAATSIAQKDLKGDVTSGAATLTGSKKGGPLGPKLSMWESAFCGALAGVITRFAIAPFDVVKIRLQALWKGNMPAAYLYLTYGAVQFVTYQKIADFWRYLDDHHSHLGPPRDIRAFAGGAVAGTTATVATYPFDLLRTRFAAQGGERRGGGVFRTLKGIVREEGVVGLYRGLSPSILQILPYMGLVFGSYDWLRKGFSMARGQAWWGRRMEAVFGPSGSAREEVISGALSGTLSKMTIYPVDTIRKRMQIQDSNSDNTVTHNNTKARKSIPGVFMAILRNEGPFALYKGLAPAILKSAPASAITFLVYERAAGFLKSLKV